MRLMEYINQNSDHFIETFKIKLDDFMAFCGGEGLTYLMVIHFGFDAPWLHPIFRTLYYVMVGALGGFGSMLGKRLFEYLFEYIKNKINERKNKKG